MEGLCVCMRGSRRKHGRTHTHIPQVCMGAECALVGLQGTHTGAYMPPRNRYQLGPVGPPSYRTVQPAHSMASGAVRFAEDENFPTFRSRNV